MSRKIESNRSDGILEIVIAMVLSGTIGIFVVESKQPAINVVFFRCVFGFLSLLLYCIIRGYLYKKYFNIKHMGYICAGGLCIVANWLLLFKSYELTSITVATIVYQTQPFFVLFIGSFLFREHLSVEKVLWTIFAFLGVVLISGVLNESTGSNEKYILGVLYSLGAAVLYGLAALIAKNLKDIKPHFIALVQVGLGAILLCPMVEVGEVDGATIDSYYWLISLGVIHTCLLYIFLYSSFGKLRVSQIAVLSFIYPVVAVICDYYVYSYKISLVQFVGIVIVLLSSIGLNLDWNIKVLWERNSNH